MKLNLEIIFKSDQETKQRKDRLELDLMKGRVYKEWNASACFRGESREECFLEANINNQS